MINLAASPYFDDFDETANFHQILFKPSYAVQSRELTQIQSILRDQIAKFGNHVFKHGSVVLPGNSTTDFDVTYVKLAPTSVDVSALEGKTVLSSTGLKGLIRKGSVVASIPTLYVSYYNTGSAGEKTFSNSETLTVSGTAGTFTTLASAAVGPACLAHVNRGVFFVNGSFVGVNPQSIVMAESAEPSCHVLLKITESIVTSDTDTTLLDPAQGSYNYAAPGADRLKIDLTLVTLPLGSVLSDDYIELMRYKEGVLEEHSRYPKYNELEKSLARRTYDESGDYVVSGLEVSGREHLKSGLNNGRYNSPTGDASKLVYTVSQGKAYLQGYEVEKISPTELVVNKARTTEVSTHALAPNYGQYLYVTNVVNLPSFLQKEQITFYNAQSGGASIGTARVLAIDYLEANTTDSNAIFKLFITDVSIAGPNDIGDVGKITFTGGSFDVLNRYTVIPNSTTNFVLSEVITASGRTAVVHKYNRSTGELYAYKNAAAAEVPLIGDNITAPSTASGRITAVEVLGRNVDDTLLVQLPKKSIYRVKNASNVTDLSYKVYHEATVTCAGGAGSFSVTGMTIDPKEAGNFIITSAAGIHPLSSATVAGDGLSVSFSGISPAGAVLKIVCAATKTGAQASPKTKTLTATSQAGLSPASTITLSKADGVRLKKVTSTVDGDVTSRYTFDGGQTDYAYLQSSITLVGTAPTGTLTVEYDYFLHNAGSGDYFSVDSYESSLMTDYFSNPTLIFKSKNTGKSYDLRNCLDFRSRVADDGTYTSGTASLSRVVQVDSRITTSLQKYVPRIDAVILEKSGLLRVISGTPTEFPKEPTIPADSMYLYKVAIPAYTYSVADVLFTKQKNRVYTMKDVGKLDDRIERLEDYVTLNETEKNIINYDVIDATTGLSRFKSGFLVDSFSDPDKIADLYNPAFNVAYVSERIVPQFEVFEVPLTQTGSSAQTTGSVVTLPYTSVEFAKQPVSSKVTNINPFAVFGWSGTMILSPSNDTWATIENLPAVYNSTTEVVNVTIPWFS